jgi:type IV secretory pathway protease TraF
MRMPEMHGFHLRQFFVISSAFIFSAMVLGIAAGYRLNVTHSLPLGLFRVSPLHHPLHRGDLVTFTLPAPLRLHRWLGSFTKPVGGLSGDLVCVYGGQLLIEGQDYGPVLDEAPVHAIPEGTCVTVAEGEVFTASHTPRSFDSRYYGTVPLADVQRSTPVWTWQESE